MPNIAQNWQTPTMVSNQLIPEEGPKAVPLLLDFASSDSYVLDYQNMQSRAFISLVQTVFIDNSQNAVEVSVEVGSIGQRIRAAAHTQGYFPILVPNPIRLVFHGAGAGVTPFFLLNMPIALVWNTPGPPI